MAERDGQDIWGDLGRELDLEPASAGAPESAPATGMDLVSITPAILQEFFRFAIRMRNAVVDTLVPPDWREKLARNTDVSEAAYFRLAIPEQGVHITKAYLAILRVRGETGKLLLRFGRPGDPRCFEKECLDGAQLLEQIRDAFREAVLTYGLLRSRTIFDATRPIGTGTEKK